MPATLAAIIGQFPVLGMSDLILDDLLSSRHLAAWGK